VDSPEIWAKTGRLLGLEMSIGIEQLKAVLAQNIKTRRLALGLAQERLGLDAGVDRTVVSKIERQLANPSLDILFRIAERLEVSVPDLLQDSRKKRL
jgi:transcriptional regulator with XRE-family HTH domain